MALDPDFYQSQYAKDTRLDAAHMVTIVTWEPGCRVFLNTGSKAAVVFEPGGKRVLLTEHGQAYETTYEQDVIEQLIAGGSSDWIELEEDQPGCYSPPVPRPAAPAEPATPVKPRVFHPKDRPDFHVEIYPNGTAFTNGAKTGRRAATYHLDDMERWLALDTWREVDVDYPSRDKPATGAEDAW